MPVFEKRSPVAVSAETLFAWHARPGAFERLVPPWDGVEVVAREGGIEDGDRVTLKMAVGPFSQRWVARHQGYEAGRSFQDVQESGPFRRWEHTHRCEPAGEGASVLVDHLEYELPLGALGGAVAGASIRQMLERTFEFRHRRTVEDLARHAAFAARPRLTVALTGATGLVGAALKAFLTTGGHRVLSLVRREAQGPDEVRWDPASGALDAAALVGVDAVVHLAGEPIAGGRWDAARKARIVDSRAGATRRLCEALGGIAGGPRVLISASAVGFYGDRGEELLDEGSPAGTGFLAEVCRGWEEATTPAEAAGMRVCRLRIGIVTTPRGGALEQMLPLFRLGLGGRLGSGAHWQSWVALDDLLGAIYHLLYDDEARGAFNAVAPEPVTNAEMTRILAKVLGRPAVLPAPAFALRLALGEMADEMVLASQRVQPRALLARGYRFRHPDLEEVIRLELGSF